MRKPTEKRVDTEVFKRTASTSKAINLGIKHFRGGTRL